MITMFRLRSARAPYTRGAVRFSSVREAVEVPADTLTAAQIERLRDDPLITIEIYGLDEDGGLIEKGDEGFELLVMPPVPPLEEAAQTLGVGIIRDPAVHGAAVALAAQLAEPASGLLREAVPTAALASDVAPSAFQDELTPVARVDGRGGVDIGGPTPIEPIVGVVVVDAPLAGMGEAVRVDGFEEYQAPASAPAEGFAAVPLGGATVAPAPAVGAVAPLAPVVAKAKRARR